VDHETVSDSTAGRQRTCAAKVHAPIRGDLLNVSVIKACLKGGTTGVTRIVLAEVSRSRSSEPSQSSEVVKGLTFLDKEEPLANSDHPKRIKPPSGYHKGAEETGQRSLESETGSPDQALAKKTALDKDPMNLMEQIVDQSNMERAWKKVRSNRGAPGPDGITIEQFPDTQRDAWAQLRQQLLEGTYRPNPARRKSIPKPDGSTRDLGIPNVIDRVIQQAVLQILTPIFDPDFSTSSFGFRPGRSAHQAIHLVQDHIRAETTSAADRQVFTSRGDAGHLLPPIDRGHDAGWSAFSTTCEHPFG